LHPCRRLPSAQGVKFQSPFETPVDDGTPGCGEGCKYPLRKSLDFYTKTVGLRELEWPGLPKPKIDDKDAPVVEVCLNFSGSLAEPYFCLLRRKGVIPDREQAKVTWVSFKTPNTRVALSRVRAAGYEVDADEQTMGLVLGLVRDPDGYTVQLIQAASVTDEVARNRRTGENQQ
jgi:hypothetical protein